MWPPVTATKPHTPGFLFKDFPRVDGQKSEENFVWKAVFYLTLRISVMYSQPSKELAQRRILTSVGSESTPKSIMLPGIFSHGMYVTEII